MGFIADAQHAMRAWERRAPNPPARIAFHGCRRTARAVTCRVHEEFDLVSEDGDFQVVVDAVVRLRATRTRHGWRVRELP